MLTPEVQRRIRRIVAWIVFPAALLYQAWVAMVRKARGEG